MAAGEQGMGDLDCSSEGGIKQYLYILLHTLTTNIETKKKNGKVLSNDSNESQYFLIH